MNGKHENKNTGKKSLALLLALLLLVGCIAGGTVAWLIAETKEVTNTFVAGKIGTLELEETKADKTYIVIPGAPIAKDPKVSYTPHTPEDDTTASVDAYVFIKIAGTGWSYTDGKFQTANGNLSFTIDTTVWTPLTDGTDGIFYKVVGAGATLPETEIIKNSEITVLNTITDGTIKDIVDAANKLTFTAYAIQKDGFATAALAWAALNP